MTYVGLFEAKQHLSQLVERVKKGEMIAITKRGVVVARLVASETPESRRETVKAIRANRRGLRLGPLSVRSLIDEGRP